jgi:hypothetical protein
MMLTVSAAGLSGTTFKPLTSTALLSFAETTIWAAALILNNGSAARAKQKPADRQLQIFMTPPPPG